MGIGEPAGPSIPTVISLSQHWKKNHLICAIASIFKQISEVQPKEKKIDLDLNVYKVRNTMSKASMHWLMTFSALFSIQKSSYACWSAWKNPSHWWGLYSCTSTICPDLMSLNDSLKLPLFPVISLATHFHVSQHIHSLILLPHHHLSLNSLLPPFPFLCLLPMN